MFNATNFRHLLPAIVNAVFTATYATDFLRDALADDEPGTLIVAMQHVSRARGGIDDLGLSEEEKAQIAVAMKKATKLITNRTPAEREAIRQELLKAIPEPLPIPAGKTVLDMFFRIRGDETEEQVYEALERLS